MKKFDSDLSLRIDQAIVGRENASSFLGRLLWGFLFRWFTRSI